QMPLHRIRQEVRVSQSLNESVLQSGQTICRNSRRSDKGPTQHLRREQHFESGALIRRLQIIENEWNVRKVGVLGECELNQNIDIFVGEPISFTRFQARPKLRRKALGFATLDGEKSSRGAGVSGD